MEKEQILSELKSKVGQTSLSDRTLTDYVAGNLPAEGTEPDDAYWNRHSAFLKSLNGNYSHDVATQVEKPKKAFQPNPNPNPNPQPQPDKPDPALAEMKKEIEAMKQEREAEKKNSLVNGLRDIVKAKAGELKVSNKAIWEDTVASIEVKDGATQEQLLESAKNAYEKKLKAYIGDGATPYGGGQNQRQIQVSSEEANARREAFRKKMQAQGRLPQDKD
ncbi:hypothetical protein [Bacteroides reticulotermitis]|uniref:Uncharacterized protein n=2 Tax=Bacteroides reticulotermitis TaxID=1133319 RepID=W4US33_9BACE|nr:hypothetical protein [Bacteroides reticulotermitis]MBB4043809.1 hypothetical protein [Bacteroides reticulotermitis]GAE83329.1 hypothetical protein JCM10512_1594 [Bacteroides reticulotermitis JCM 10512]